MNDPATLLVCVVTIAVSVWAWQDRFVEDRLIFRPDAILARREWYRLFSSALIHANFPHLAFNLLGFYSFAGGLEWVLGSAGLLGLYLASVLGGSLLSLYLHRHHDYASLGASGGVCGIIFAAIFVNPGTSVGFLFLPVWIPGPVYAVLYLAMTFWALRQGGGKIAHDAHFGGAITGLLLAFAIAPGNCLESPWLFLSCLGLSCYCLWVLSRDPMGLSGKVFSFGEPEEKAFVKDRDYSYNATRKRQREEADRILDKISAEGFASLTPEERKTLDEFSRKNRRR